MDNKIFTIKFHIVHGHKLPSFLKGHLKFSKELSEKDNEYSNLRTRGKSFEYNRIIAVSHYAENTRTKHLAERLKERKSVRIANLTKPGMSKGKKNNVQLAEKTRNSRQRSFTLHNFKKFQYFIKYIILKSSNIS